MEIVAWTTYPCATRQVHANNRCGGWGNGRPRRAPEGVAAPEQEQRDGEVRRVDDVVLQRAQHDHRHQHHVGEVPDQAQATPGMSSVPSSGVLPTGMVHGDIMADTTRQAPAGGTLQLLRWHWTWVVILGIMFIADKASARLCIETPPVQDYSGIGGSSGAHL